MDSRESSELDSLNRDELLELYKLNAEKISALGKDIKLFKWQKNQLKPSSIGKLKCSSRKEVSSLSMHHMKEKLDSEIQELEGQIEDTKRFTGIHVEKVHRKVDQIENSDCITKYRAHLRILGEKVRLAYNVHESFQFQENTQNEKFVDEFEAEFKVDIDNAIGDIVKEAASKEGFRGVTSLLTSYIQCMSQRDQAIQEIKEKHSQNVSHTFEGRTHFLKIFHAKENRPVFIITWRINQSPISHFYPELSLEVEATEELRRMDKEGILKDAPDVFAYMISTLGIQQAIHSIMQMVVTDGEEVDLYSM